MDLTALIWTNSHQTINLTEPLGDILDQHISALPSSKHQMRDPLVVSTVQFQMHGGSLQRSTEAAHLGKT